MMTELSTPFGALTGTLGAWKLIPDMTTPPAWARYAVSYTDDDITEERRFFRTQLQATRWASWCDHPTTVVVL